MTTFVLTLQLITFAVFATAILFLIGYPIASPFSRSYGVYHFLIAPTTGPAIILLACQWAMPILPVSVIITVVGLITIPLSVMLLAKRLRFIKLEVRKCGVTLAALSAMFATVYLTLLVPLIKGGYLTVHSPGSDGLFIYAPTANYLQSHPFLPFHHALTNPITFYLDEFYKTGPGSLASLIAAVSTVLGWQPYAVVEPLDSLCYALTIPILYILLIQVFRFSTKLSLVAVVVFLISQLGIWTAGFDFSQQMQAQPLFVLALLCAAHAMTNQSDLSYAAAAIIVAVIPATYFPLFAVYVVVVTSAVVVHFAVSLYRHKDIAWIVSLARLAALSVIFAAPSLYWLVFRGGIAAWNHFMSVNYPGAAPDHFFSWGYLFGVAPIAVLYKVIPIELVSGNYVNAANHWLTPIYTIVLVIGLLVLLKTRRYVAAAMIIGGLGYVLYVRYGAGFVYGWIKAYSYIWPLACAAVTVGGCAVLRGSWRATRRVPALLMSGRMVGAGSVLIGILGVGAGGVVLLALVVSQIVSTVEAARLFVRWGPSLNQTYLGVASLPHLIPRGGSVFMYEPPGYARPVNILQTYTTAAYFLSDMNVSISQHPFSQDPFPGQALAPDTPLPYDFLLRPIVPASEFPTGGVLLWQNASLDLQLFALHASR